MRKNSYVLWIMYKFQNNKLEFKVHHKSTNKKWAYPFLLTCPNKNTKQNSNVPHESVHAVVHLVSIEGTQLISIVKKSDHFYTKKKKKKKKSCSFCICIFALINQLVHWH